MAGSAHRTLAEKIWDAHVVRSAEGEPDLLYIDLHLLHEVTSPQAFDGLRAAGRKVRRPDLTIATEDHNVPTTGITGPGAPPPISPVPLYGPDSPFTDPVSRTQVEALRKNCAEFGVRLHPMGDADQGIVHVIGPQLGLTQPGLTIVCGDSHTSTHGALGALAFGIGTSEVEHVLATQTLPQVRPKTMAITVDGALPEGVTAKDLILAIIAKIGTGGGQGYVLEYRGSAIRALSMAWPVTVCNMSIEAGAWAGLVAPDDRYLCLPGGPAARAFGGRVGGRARLLAHAADRRRRDLRPRGRPRRRHPDAVRDLGHQPRPGAAAGLVGAGPRLLRRPGRPGRRRACADLHGPGARHRAARHNGGHGFVGSCTNGRIEDLRAAATRLQGLDVAPSVRMLVVPGSMAVRAQAEREGLDAIFTAAGADWRSAGCSMCLGMNPDKLSPGQRSASTSNRNFEGRQGKGGRTHLVSPEVAAATAVTGHLAAPADL